MQNNNVWELLRCFYSTWPARNNETNEIPSVKWNNSVAVSPEEKANSLKEYFYSDFTVDNGKPCSSITTDHLVYCEVDKLKINCEGVLKLLFNIDTTKSCGPDNVKGILLKTFATIILLSLNEIFSYLLTTSTLPTIWKTAKVQPKFEKSNKQLPSNYRPISLTPILCKLLEHIVSSHIRKLFNKNDIFTDNQYGFRTGRSCETQLAYTTGHISMTRVKVSMQ